MQENYQGFLFTKKAPSTYSWIGGSSGPNDYPTLYGIRILKNGTEVFKQTDIATTQDWTLESFNFEGNPAFEINSTTTFSFELRAYCRVGNGASTSVWDIDEFSVEGCCGSTNEIDLELTKMANVSEAANGDLVTYTISVINQGPGDATGVSVSDVLPAGVSYSSSSPSKGTFTSGSTSLGSIEVSVGSSTDDAEENVSSGNVNHTSSDLELTQESSTQLIGMRFQNLDIPAGVVITNAYIQFTVDEVADVATDLIIQAQDTDDATTFSTTNADISSRATTSANVPWSPPAWNTVGEAGSDQQTPDLSAIVQEIVNRGGWNAGNDMVFIVSGSGKRVAESYDGSTTAAPTLTVEYINGGVWNIGSLANGEIATLGIEVVIDDISNPITNFAQVQTANEDDIDSTPGNDMNNLADEDDEDDVTILPAMDGCNEVLVQYTGDCNDPEDSYPPSNVAGCIIASDLAPSAGASYASCAGEIVCFASLSTDLVFAMIATEAMEFNHLVGDFLYPVDISTAGGPSNDPTCPATFSFGIEIYKNAVLQETLNSSVPKDMLTTQSFSLSTPSNFDQW